MGRSSDGAINSSSALKKPLANDLLFGKLAHGGRVRISVENNELTFEIESNEALATDN
jgi:ATP-dependent Clp protease ATP-binding subunit ClpA